MKEMQEKMEEKMKEMQEEMKEMQEKLAAQEAIITEMNSAIPVSTQNTNPGQNLNLQQNRIGKGFKTWVLDLSIEEYWSIQSFYSLNLYPLIID